MDKPKSTEWPSEDRIESIGQNGPSGDHYEDDAFRECERRLREAELTRHITPAELVNRQLMQRCDELQDANAMLAEENQRLRELCPRSLTMADYTPGATRRIPMNLLETAHEATGKWLNRDDLEAWVFSRFAQLEAEHDALAAKVADMREYIEEAHEVFVGLSEYWNGGEGLAAEDAAQHASDEACNMLDKKPDADERPETSLADRIAHVAEQCDLPRLLRDYRAMVGLASITGPAKRERIEHVTSVEIAMFGAKQKYVISATRGRQAGGDA